jgi:acetyl esterase/lipase
MNKRIIPLFLAWCISTNILGQLQLSEVPIQPDSLIYKQTPEGTLKMYFHYPDDWSALDLRPAIVFFFGGGWSTGSVEQFSPQAKYLASRGMVAIRADYRVSSRHGTTPTQCVEDGKSAVRWIRINADKLGVDPNSIVGSGGSAGGHVAACAAMVEFMDATGEDQSVSSKPDLLVLFNPVMETNSERIVKMMGDETTAMLLSPNNWIGTSTPDGIMFFGTEDQLLKPAIRSRQTAYTHGVQFEIWTAKGQKHAFFNNSPWMEWTLYLTDQFLQQHGYLDGKPEIKLPDSVVMKQLE